MKKLRMLAFLLLAVSTSMLLFACSSPAQHQKAIEQAIVGYTDYYIEARNLKQQVFEGYQKIDPKQSAVSYTILVNIPDYSSAEFRSVPYSLPEPDYSPNSESQYQKNAILALRQTLETYALQNPVSAYFELPVSFDVVSAGNGWAAAITGASKAAIQQAVESRMLQILESNDAYQANNRFALVADALYRLLADAMHGADYAALVQISQITPNTDGTYTASLSYPDPSEVYTALGEAYVASFAQPFYGDPFVVSLTAEGLSALNPASFSRVEDVVTVSFDPETNTCAFLDAKSLLARLSEAKQQAEETASAEVNAVWRIEPLDPPASGSVLEGESAGNEIVLKTGATLGRYYYVRFFAISGEDVSEDGTLTAGMFVVGGKTAKILLPGGHYRISCFVGSDWYGIDTLFGKSGKEYAGKSAIESREGYVNTVSFQ